MPKPAVIFTMRGTVQTGREIARHETLAEYVARKEREQRHFDNVLYSIAGAAFAAVLCACIIIGQYIK
jgi:hypothetical protein